MGCVLFGGGLKGKTDGNDGLNPCNPLLRRFNKCVEMTDGFGGRDSRRNSRPSIGFLLDGLSPSLNELRAEDPRPISAY